MMGRKGISGFIPLLCERALLKLPIFTKAGEALETPQSPGPGRSPFSRHSAPASWTRAQTRRIGFRAATSAPVLIERTKAEVAGTLLTARLALENGLACNTAGGQQLPVGLELNKIT